MGLQQVLGWSRFFCVFLTSFSFAQNAQPLHVLPSASSESHHRSGLLLAQDLIELRLGMRFEAETESDKTVFEQTSFLVTAADVAQVAQMQNTLFSTQATAKPATFQDYLAGLRSSSQYWSSEQKDLYLMMVGSKLGRSPYYDHSGPTVARSGEEQYQRITQGLPAGSCTHLHRDLLGPLVTALYGNTGKHPLDVGVHNTMWTQGNQDPGSHALLYFRHPQSGKIRILNYGTLLSTPTQRIDQAVEISSQAWSPITNAIRVESKPGQVKLVQTPFSKMIDRTLSSHLQEQVVSPVLLRVEAGNRGNVLSLRLGVEREGVRAVGFVGSSDYHTPDGTYKVNYLGAGLRGTSTLELRNRALDEVRLLGEVYGGVLDVEAPELLPSYHAYGSKRDESLATMKYLLRIELQKHATTGYFDVSGIEMLENKSFNKQKIGVLWSPDRWPTQGKPQAGWEQVWQYRQKSLEGSQNPAEFGRVSDRIYVSYVIPSVSGVQKRRSGNLTTTHHVYFLEGGAVGTRHQVGYVVTLSDRLRAGMEAELTRLHSEGNDPFFRHSGTAAKIAASVDYVLSRRHQTILSAGVALDNSTRPFSSVDDLDSMWSADPYWNNNEGEVSVSGWVALKKSFGPKK